MKEAERMPATRVDGSVGEVLRIFARLGLGSFGGPIAHLGYFRDEFVVRRRWLDDAGYADLVALCQFLPGPASSQVGFAIGMMRAGLPGALAAWTGFTLPSALALLLFAWGAPMLDGVLGAGLLHGLKLVAVAIVAQAVQGMAKSLCPDRARAGIATVAAVLLLLVGSSWMQLIVIALGAVAGLALCASSGEPRADSAQDADALPGIREPGRWISRRGALACFVAFVALLLALPMLAAFFGWAPLSLFDEFYRAGALVFGGGHVVLPLLHDGFVTPGWISEQQFIAGYGAAQAVPGPLFSFAAYLGAVVDLPVAPPVGAAIGLAGIFLPGMLILSAALPFWHRLRQLPGARAAVRGVNAAVVGVLAAALYSSIWTNAVHGPVDLAIALSGFVLLTAFRAPPLLVVVLAAVAGCVQSLAAGIPIA